MPLPDRIKRFIEINTAGRVTLLCRNRGILDPRRIQIFTRATQEAIETWAGGLADPGANQINVFLDAQLGLLAESLRRQPTPEALLAALYRSGAGQPATPALPEVASATNQSRPPHHSVGKLAEARSLPDKLEEQRQPLRQLLLEDCVQLSLVTPDQARQLATQMAGKTRQAAETEVMAELRNRLHEQIRNFMQAHQGGPWKTPEQQREIRLDITETSCLADLVALTRQLVREFSHWEENQNKGFFRNLLPGRIWASWSKQPEEKR